MTKEKLEYFRKMHLDGMLTKEEFADIERTYHFQDHSFLEIDGKKEVIKKKRPRSYRDDPYADVQPEKQTIFDQLTSRKGEKRGLSSLWGKPSQGKGFISSLIDALEELNSKR
ncbi:MAG TPA: hypothetical protein GX733_04765 [Tissierellia bacterium]|jgi:hypothetical protein|nr:hypothetical protein [Tissierellia bacterium]